MKKLFSYVFVILFIFVGMSTQNTVRAMQDSSAVGDSKTSVNASAENKAVKEQAKKTLDQFTKKVRDALAFALSKVTESCNAAGMYVSETYVTETTAFSKDGFSLYLQHKYDAAKKLAKDEKTKIACNKIIHWIGVTALLHYILIRSGVWNTFIFGLFSFGVLLLPLKLGYAVFINLPLNILKDSLNTVTALLNIKSWKQA